MAALRGRCSCSPPGPPGEAPACDRMRGWLAQGRVGERADRGRGAKAAGGLRQRARHPAAAGLEHEAVHHRDRPLQAGPEDAIATELIGRRAPRRRRHLPRQPLPQGRRRPGAGHPRLLQRLSRRPRHQPLLAQGAGPRRRDQSDHRPALRRRDDLRPAPRRRRLRLRDQPLHRPALRPRLQLRLQRLDQLQRLLLGPGEAGCLEASPFATRRRGVSVPAQVALAKTPAWAPNGSAWSALPP